jgi:ribose 5-phosphate isomerase A
MLEKAPGSDEQRQQAAAAVIGEVRDGMRLGLGSGRTAEHFVRFLGEKVRAGLKVVGVPTSERTAKLAREVGVPLTTLNDEPELDLTIDGADEVDPALHLIKGGGGALLREKIVAAASARMIVIVDAGKLVEALGAFPLPVEVVPFGEAPARRAIAATAEGLGMQPRIALRMAGAAPYVTDGGNHILDVSLGRIDDPEALARALDAIPAVVGHGLFIGLASVVAVAGPGGIEWLKP